MIRNNWPNGGSQITSTMLAFLEVLILYEMTDPTGFTNYLLDIGVFGVLDFVTQNNGPYRFTKYL